MTQRSVTYLKARFETGDIPTQTDYQDVFDSFVNLEASAMQTISGGLALATAEATHVSASTGRFNNGYFDGTRVSAVSVSAGTLWANSKVVHSNQVVAPAGTTQGSATATTLDLISASAEQNERAIVLPSLEPGRVNLVMNTGTTALLVFPPSGQNFVGSAANGAISIPTLTGVTIPHLVSAYGFIR